MVTAMKLTISSLVAALVFLSGCSSTEGEASKDVPAASNGDKASEAAEPAAKVSEEPEVAQPKFGEAYNWEDGISITVSKPKSFKPSEYTAVDGAADHLKFEIRLVNSTGKPFDPALVYATLQSGNEEAEAVFDSENGVGDSPSTKLLDGREVKWTVGFGVKDPSDLVMEISPDAGIEYAGAIFTN